MNKNSSSPPNILEEETHSLVPTTQKPNEIKKDVFQLSEVRGLGKRKRPEEDTLK